MKYLTLILTLLVLTGCEYAISVSMVEKAEKMCESHQGVKEIYANGNYSIGVKCVDGTRVLSSDFPYGPK